MSAHGDFRANVGAYPAVPPGRQDHPLSPPSRSRKADHERRPARLIPLRRREARERLSQGSWSRLHELPIDIGPKASTGRAVLAARLRDRDGPGRAPHRPTGDGFERQNHLGDVPELRWHRCCGLGTKSVHLRRMVRRTSGGSGLSVGLRPHRHANPRGLLRSCSRAGSLGEDLNQVTSSRRPMCRHPTAGMPGLL
jgi:hypothetical protein